MEHHDYVWVKFRVFGCLRPGFLKVNPIAPEPPIGHVLILDIFVDEVAADMVPADRRVPNAIFWGLVVGGRSIVDARADVSEQDAPEYFSSRDSS